MYITLHFSFVGAEMHLGKNEHFLNSYSQKNKNSAKINLHCVRLKYLNFIKKLLYRSTKLWVNFVGPFAVRLSKHEPYRITVISPWTLSSNSSLSASSAVYLYMKA